ncbi:hypothetical protein LMJF_03_0560 [Leishmania major strain Friedlin]|uniref:Uncharacterized protein n=1 Tax=Leishmania major TaxID=5664 RepID=E9ACK1_LEIMA|nr:hypothetical protein LMJF_03_0560 [Leishmania major strain Friedlin]CAG9567282.1 hypothetical_protein_-_conserved [Leishmania major strain Friedlin]CBZ12018.1 hypothetical protein LMJF_03_0560 [Leishmania major strain Friedlin]|eukprot:XP_003721732.1 hypothetical protein LMJF_03_0560 [Leishmania major strain Friedlin]
MSSDFETLSCNLESSEPRRRHCRRSSSSIGCDSDTLDDLIADDDAQLLRRLAVRNSAPGAGARRALSSDHASAHLGRRESALYGYRAYGVTGGVAATSPAARGGACGTMPLSTKGPITCCHQPATVAHTTVKSTDSLDNLGGAFTATVVTPRAPGGGGVSWASATAAPTTTAAHASAFRDREAASLVERQVTCPPDTSSLTSVTSAATMTASATTGRTHDSTNDDDSSEDNEGAEEGRAHLKGGHTVQHRRLAHDASEAAAASRTPQPTSRAPPHRSARDFDGFYNTGLLLEDDDDDDDDAAESELSRRPARAVDSAAAPFPSTALNASLLYMQGPAGQRGSDAPISFRRAQAAPATPGPHTKGHGKRPASPTSAKKSTVTAARPLFIASRREAASEELCRLAVALPTMTTVHWLSLVITLLVPVNLLCLDVMALGWIRRRVDASYGGTSALPSSGLTTSPTSLRVVICGAAGVSTGVAEAPSSCGNDSGFTFNMGAPTFTSTSGGGGGCGRSGSSSGGSTAGAGNPRRVDAKTSSFSSAHTVPALCSVILWLLAPNGLLCRLVIHRLRRPTGEAVADDHEPEDESVVNLSPSLAATAAAPSTPSPLHRSAASSTDEYRHLRAEWQVCCDVYERVRQLAPHLEVIELFIRYACLWVMLHAPPLPCATVASEWTDAWLLKAPAPEEEKVMAQNSSHWRASSSVTASVSPRRASDAIAAA